jgi:hypothetical protein
METSSFSVGIAGREKSDDEGWDSNYGKFNIFSRSRDWVKVNEDCLVGFWSSGSGSDSGALRASSFIPTMPTCLKKIMASIVAKKKRDK